MNRIAKGIAIATIGVLSLTACGDPTSREADTVSENLSTAADQFEVQRRIVGINGITDKIIFDVEGRCSITRDGDLVVICKHGPDDYKKHFIGLSDNVTFVAVQTESLAVDKYRTRVVIRPQAAFADLDLVTG